MEEVPTICLNGLSEAQRKAYIIADNKIALNAGWNEELLKLELVTLDEMGFDYSEFGFDFEFNMGEDTDDEEKYTQVISSPIYEIRGELPSIEELYSTEKADSLASEVLKANIPDEIKKFLISASYRHIVFNYAKIAEFYAHQDGQVQDFMEKSALVIIDINKAVENGFVLLSESIDQMIEAQKGEQ